MQYLCYKRADTDDIVSLSCGDNLHFISDISNCFFLVLLEIYHFIDFVKETAFDFINVLY